MYVPDTNNALEIKKNHRRERTILSRFTVVLFSIVDKGSKERNLAHDNLKKVRTSIINNNIITLDRWIYLA